MSSSTGRYQSRLFNFIHRQSRRVVDEYERALRHVKVASVWSVQILLYPAYLLVQTSRMTGHQLKQAVQEGLSQALATGKPTSSNRPECVSIPPSDTPIQQVLRALNATESQKDTLEPESVTSSSKTESLNFSTLVTWASQYVPWLSKFVPKETYTTRTLTPGNPSLKLPPLELTADLVSLQAQASAELNHQRPTIQGIACQLTTHSLVLVTPENQILDILTPQQQRKLQQRISWELASYWHQWRIAHTQSFRTRLKPSVDQHHILPPVRFFWGLMAWVQTGPVAMAANLFQESTLAPTQLSTSFLQEPLAFLDHTVAQLEAQQQHTLAALVLLPQMLVQKIHQLSQHSPEGISAQKTETQLLKIQTLIHSAVDYFFGTRWNSSQLNSADQPALSGSSPGEKQLLGHPIKFLTAAPTAITLRTQTLLQRLQVSLHQYTSHGVSAQPYAATEATETQRLNIQTLIRSAVDYFFGKVSWNLVQTGSPDQPTLASTSQQKNPQLKSRPSLLTPQPSSSQPTAPRQPKPWLTLSDLFGHSTQPSVDQTAEILPEATAATATLPPSTATETPLASIWNQIKRSPKSPSPATNTRQRPKLHSAGKTVRQTQNSPLIQPQKTSALSRTKQLRHSPTATASPAKDAPPNPALDWIETQATPLGYVKHPLELLLEWVDSAMLWLEELILKIWRWVRQSLP